MIISYLVITILCAIGMEFHVSDAKSKVNCGTLDNEWPKVAQHSRALRVRTEPNSRVCVCVCVSVCVCVCVCVSVCVHVQCNALGPSTYCTRSTRARTSCLSLAISICASCSCSFDSVYSSILSSLHIRSREQFSFRDDIPRKQQKKIVSQLLLTKCGITVKDY